MLYNLTMKQFSISQPLSAAYITLGCKVNQYESEQIRSSLEALGLVTVRYNDPASVYIINTCSVTHTADSKSRSAIKRAIRQNPNALVIVTGCYSQLEPMTAASIEGVDMVIANEHKDDISDYVAIKLNLPKTQTCQPNAIQKRIRTRAVVKVQDGCDNYCSYCIIPYARPVMKSRPLDEVLEEIQMLTDSGFQEIVLTGIRLGSYNHRDRDIADLVAESAKIQDIGRVRLSSIEPWEISDRLLQAMNNPHVCRHLHIPLQSGDDSILKSMNRKYDTKTYLDMLSHVREVLPHIGITTDVIVGFPGEDSTAYENSIRTVVAANFARLHVFRYSRRTRTKAADMSNQVNDQEKQTRAERMESLGRDMQREFASEWIGRTLPVLVETETKKTGVYRGYSDNYIEVKMKLDSRYRNKIVIARVCEVAEDGSVFAEISD